MREVVVAVVVVGSLAAKEKIKHTAKGDDAGCGDTGAECRGEPTRCCQAATSVAMIGSQLWCASVRFTKTARNVRRENGVSRTEKTDGKVQK